MNAQDTTKPEVHTLPRHLRRLEAESIEIMRDVVAEFNRYNARKLVVGDRATADILVGGNFRADNVDSFVRLLDVGFGVAAAPHGDEIVLRRRR